MNTEDKLRLQAYLDNECDSVEARSVAAWLARDAEAVALFNELKWSRKVLLENEPELSMPETRDFFWSKIQKEIEGTAPLVVRPASSAPSLPLWLRWLVPATGVAGLLLLAATNGNFKRLQSASSVTPEIEAADDSEGAITYHSQQHGLTVVWVKTYPH